MACGRDWHGMGTHGVEVVGGLVRNGNQRGGRSVMEGREVKVGRGSISTIQIVEGGPA